MTQAFELLLAEAFVTKSVTKHPIRSKTRSSSIQNHKTKKVLKPLRFKTFWTGRGDRIWTCDLLVPKSSGCLSKSFHVGSVIRRKPCKMTWADMEKHILLPIRCNKTQIWTKDSARLGCNLARRMTTKTTRSTHNIPRNGPKCNGPKGRDTIGLLVISDPRY